MIKCKHCGHENMAGTLVCINCARMLTNGTSIESTRALGDTDFEEGTPKWGSARFASSMHLILSLLEGDKQFIFDSEEIDEVQMGRINPDTHVAPPVDLTDCGGVEKGVSRNHARIVKRDGALHVVDDSSSNGTFLNGQRLIAGQPRILRDGDDIRLGHLILRVTFERMEKKATFQNTSRD